METHEKVASAQPLGSDSNNSTRAASVDHLSLSRNTKSAALKSWYREVKDGLKLKLHHRHSSSGCADYHLTASSPQLLSVSSLDPDVEEFEFEYRLRRNNAIKVRPPHPRSDRWPRIGLKVESGFKRFQTIRFNIKWLPIDF